MKIVIYQKPTCTTCRQVYSALKESGIDFTDVNYFLEPFTKSKLKDLLSKMGMRVQDLIRKNEDIYKKLELADKDLSENQWLDLLVQYPDLIQRPIVENGPKAVLARPAERVKEII